MYQRSIGRPRSEPNAGSPGRDPGSTSGGRGARPPETARRARPSAVRACVRTETVTARRLAEPHRPCDRAGRVRYGLVVARFSSEHHSRTRGGSFSAREPAIEPAARTVQWRIKKSNKRL